MNVIKKVIAFGLTGGFITVLGFFLWPIVSSAVSAEDGHPDVKIGEIIGFVAMIVALSMVFFGVRSLRNSQGGRMSFKNAFLYGLAIVVIISVIYVAGWMMYYPVFMPDFVEEYFAAQTEALKSQDHRCGGVCKAVEGDGGVQKRL